MSLKTGEFITIDHLREVGRLAGLGCEIVTKYVRRIVKDANYML